MKILVGALLAALAASVWLDQEDKGKPLGLSAVRAQDIAWQKAEGMPAGVMVSHAAGDAKGGAAVDFLKFPAGTRVPPHWHSANHVVTVLSGKLEIGSPGLEKGLEVGPGGYFRIMGKTPHWTMAKEETVFTVSGDAPNDLHWAKPD